MHDGVVREGRLPASLAAPSDAQAARVDAAELDAAGMESAGCVTVAAVVRELAELLAAGRVEDATREARDIIAAVADVPRFWPSLHATDVLGARATQRARGGRAACCGSALRLRRGAGRLSPSYPRGG
jgi:hypothetical protein